MLIFDSNTDRRVQTITITSVSLIFLLLIFVISVEIHQLLKGIILLMVLLPTILLWQLSCRKYEISENSIYIKYPVFHKKIDTSLIKEIIEKPGLAEVELKSAFNTRGFMGYIGFYKDKEHGLVSLHCNSLEGLLLLRVGEKKYLINPHNKLSFLEAMRPHRIASKDQTK